MSTKKKTAKKAAPKYTPTRRPFIVPSVANRPGESSAAVIKYLTKSKDKQRSVEEIASGTGLSLDATKGALRRLFSKDQVVRSEGKPYKWQLTPTDTEMEKMLEDEGNLPSGSMIQNQTPVDSGDQQEQKEESDQTPSEDSSDNKITDENHTVIPTAADGIQEEVDIKDLHKAEDTESGFVQ